jgi:hypothetical protein
MFKKYAWLITAIMIFIAIIAVARIKEDGWLCQKGIWVKHGNPIAAMPTYFCDK